MTPQTFKQALSWLKPAMTKQSRYGRIPILDTVLIQSNGHVTMTATDLNIGIRVILPPEGPEFDMAVPFKPLFDLSRELAKDKEGNITFPQSDNKHWPFALDAGTFHCDLATMDAEDFPAWPDKDEAVETRWANVADVVAALPSDLGGKRFGDHWDYRAFAAALKRLPERPVEVRITEKYVLVQSWEITICQRIADSSGLRERLLALPDTFFDLDN